MFFNVGIVGIHEVQQRRAETPAWKWFQPPFCCVYMSNIKTKTFSVKDDSFSLPLVTKTECFVPKLLIFHKR